MNLARRYIRDRIVLALIILLVLFFTQVYLRV